jgi:hypothetical protein
MWIGLALPFALHRGRRHRLTPNSVYAYAAISSLLAAAFFFLMFVYFLMFCLPVSFLVAALAFRFIALPIGSRTAAATDQAATSRP